jgi:hypothetical protein
MNYEVILTDGAKLQLDEACIWYEQNAPQIANDWYNGFLDSLFLLEQNPERFSIARESDAFLLPPKSHGVRTPSVFVLIAFRTFRRRSAPRSINLWLRKVVRREESVVSVACFKFEVAGEARRGEFSREVPDLGAFD